METEEHKQRHVELHESLDELFADYITHHPEQRDFLNMPVRQLIEWSVSQTTHPTPDDNPK